MANKLAKFFVVRLFRRTKKEQKKKLNWLEISITKTTIEFIARRTKATNFY